MAIMARLPRISPNGIPVHIIQRGNNRQVCSVAEESAILDSICNYPA
jgi:putative transposase